MLSFDITNLALTIINLIVLYLILRHFLFKPVLGIMEKRQSLIEEQLAHASDTGKQAEQLKSQYEERLKKADTEAGIMVEKAKQDAKIQYEKIVDEANGQAGRIIENAKKTAQADKEKTLREAKTELAGLVMTAAAKVIGEENTLESNKSLYNQFLAGAGDGNDTNLN